MNQIFARAMPAETDAPETSITAIVAKIRQPSGLRLALANWQQLQRDYSDKMAQLRDAIAEMQNRGGEAATSAAPLTAGIVELDHTIRELRGKLQESLGDVDDAAARRIATLLNSEPDAPAFLTVDDSLGGSAFAGIAIYEACRAHPAPVTCFAAQRCHSAALIGFLGGDIRLAGPDAQFLAHTCARLPSERSCARVLRATADELEQIDGRIPAQGASVHARVSDHAGSGRCLQ